MRVGEGGVMLVRDESYYASWGRGCAAVVFACGVSDLLMELGLGAKVPRLPESSHIACYIAGYTYIFPSQLQFGPSKNSKEANQNVEVISRSNSLGSRVSP